MPSLKPTVRASGLREPLQRAPRQAVQVRKQSEDAESRAKQERTRGLMAAEQRRREELEKQGYCF